MQYVIEVGIDL